MSGDNNSNTLNTRKSKCFVLDSTDPSTPTTIEALDDDCLREIFSYFNFVELISLDMVCMRWSSLCQDTWNNVLGLSTARSSWYFQDKQHQLHEDTIPQKMMKHVLMRCGNFITFLELSWFDAACCMDQLQIILPLCPNLECMTINAVPSAVAMRALRDNCVNLRRFTIEGISRDLEEDLAMMLENNRHLRYFSIRSSLDDTTGEFLKYLACDSIEEIILGTDFMFDSYFFNLSIKRFKRLRSVTYEPSGRSEDSIMETISERTALTRLSLRHNYLSNVLPDAYNHLAKLINLEKLDLWFARDLGEDTFINILDNCRKLESLSIGFCLSITNYGMSNIAKLTKLKTLRMEHLCRVTDEPIGHLPDTLEVLICSHNTQVKDDGIIKLMERAPKLREIALDGCSITKNLVRAAVQIIKKRTNGIILEIRIHGDELVGYHVPKIPPLLRIITAVHGLNADESD